MKNLFFLLASITTFFYSCTPDNPNPNGSGSQTYTQGTPVTDIDGNTYPTIISNCGQTWTAKNLNVSKYRNGDVIPQVTDRSQWYNLTTGAWCYYLNDPGKESSYGKLYNWYAVNDPRGLAPQGWHIPSDQEWTSFENCIGQREAPGGAMKETGIMYWQSNLGATNNSGFSGRGGGALYVDPPPYPSNFMYITLFGNWWSSSTDQSNTDNAWKKSLYSGNTNVSRSSISKKCGFSVRCVKD